MNRRLAGALLALPLLLSLPLAACGGGEDDNGLPTAGSTAPPAADAGPEADDLSEAERHQMLLDYAACMREHGIEIADPKPGEGVQLQIEGDPAQADAAMQACQSLLPGGEPPEADPEAFEQMLAFARCMRENGFPNFADPKEGEGINISPETLGGMEPDDPRFLAAQEKCHEQAGMPGGPPDTNSNSTGGQA